MQRDNQRLFARLGSKPTVPSSYTDSRQATSGIASPIVSGSGNTVSYGSRASDKSLAKH